MAWITYGKPMGNLWETGTLWSFVTVCELEHGPVERMIFPIESGDVPVRYSNVYQRVGCLLNGMSRIGTVSSCDP